MTEFVVKLCQNASTMKEIAILQSTITNIVYQNITKRTRFALNLVLFSLFVFAFSAKKIVFTVP